MSRDSQWATTLHALEASWRWPATQQEIDELAQRTASWANLTHLLEAVEYFQRNTPDKRPGINELAAEAVRRRRLATATNDDRGPCPACNATGFLDGPHTDGWPTVKPCPTCRPGTATMHAQGFYNLDVPANSDAYAAAAEKAKQANDTAPRYSNRPNSGPPVARPDHLKNDPLIPSTHGD